MGRLARSLLLGAAAATLAGSAFAGTSLLGPGYTNWFYACGGGQTMYLAIRHSDGTLTRFSLQQGERRQTFVQQGDVEAWRCGAPVDPRANFLLIPTLPPP